MQQETRDNFPYRLTLSSRWQDCDAYSHVNNVVYYSWFDTAVTTMLIERGVISMRDSLSIGLCVESQCQFFAPIEFPETFEACVRVGKLGTKSVRYEIAIFKTGDNHPAAAGHFVHVMVDRTTRRPVAISERQRAALRDYAVSV